MTSTVDVRRLCDSVVDAVRESTQMEELARSVETVRASGNPEEIEMAESALLEACDWEPYHSARDRDIWISKLAPNEPVTRSVAVRKAMKDAGFR